MSIKIEKTDNQNELKLTFEVDAKTFEDAIVSVFNKNAKYFNIAGFRKGKAPMHIVEKHYGTEIFYEDAFREVLENVYPKEIKENNIDAVSSPDIDISQIEKGKGLNFTAIVQIKPEITLGKYKGIQIKKIEYNVSDEDIEHELGHMAERNSRLVSKESETVENGDIAIIDFEGFVDDVVFDGGKGENYELTIGSNTFIPGFEEQIIGMKIGDLKDVKVKFPEEYHASNLAGKDAMFKVTVHEIKQKEIPLIDDEFAKDASEFETLEELKNSIKEKIQKEKETKAKYETEEEALKVVCDDIKVDIPRGMIETEIDNMVKEIENKLKYQGMGMEQYLGMVGKTEEEFRKEYEEQATKTVKNSLVLEAIVKEEKIEIDGKDLEEKIKEMATMYGRPEEELKENEAFIDFLKNRLKTEKAIEFIVANAKKK